MSFFNKISKIWKDDRLFGGVFKNSSYLLSSSTIAVGLNTVQTLLSTLLLGPAAFGALGNVIAYASSVNRLLSFRMNEVVIKNAGQDLATGNKERAAAIVKAAVIAESLTSLLAYLILVLLGPLAATYILRDTSLIPWIFLYGISVLASLAAETSTAVLQLADRYRSQAALNLAQAVLTTVLIALAFLLHGSVYHVLMAYLAGKLLLGIGTMVLGLRAVVPLLGKDWWKTPLSLIEDKRRLVRFAISTNLSGTVNMLLRDSETLWVGYFTSNTGAGYYKLAIAVMNLIVLPVTPLIQTTFPQITKNVGKREWKLLRALLKRTSFLAAVWCGVVLGGLALLGPWFFGWYKGGEYLPAYPAMLVLWIGYAAQGVLFWNRPLLLAFNHPNFPLAVNTAIGAAKIGLMFLLVPTYGYMTAAWLLTGYFTLAVGIIVWRGLQEIDHAQKTLPPLEAAP